jgi:hypothetical protein
VKSEKPIEKGDLVRLCVISEFVALSPEKIDWCYGIYIDSVVQIHSYDGFVDAEEEYDRVLYNGSIMECDHFWYIERVS